MWGSACVIACFIWILCELRTYKWTEGVIIAVVKNVFGASTGFEPMASALALQCCTNWAKKTNNNVGSRPICWIQRTPWKEWNIWIFCKLLTLVVHCSANAEAIILNLVEAAKTFFRLNCDLSNRKHNCDDHTFSSLHVLLQELMPYTSPEKVAALVTI